MSRATGLRPGNWEEYGMADAVDRVRWTQELHLFVADYWHDVDTNWGRNAGDHYTEDATFVSSRNTYSGRDQIEKFYAWRVNRGARVAIHSMSNFRVEPPQDSSSATCTYYLTLYADDGVPVLPTHPPIQLALMTDKFVRADGRWLCTQRKFTTLFAGGTPTTSPTVEQINQKK